MKKLVSLISALTMCAVMAAPMVSSATVVTEDESSATSSTVNCKTIVDSSYTVKIPDGAADLEDPVDLTVSATGVCIQGNQTLKVDVSSANTWNLKDANSGDLAYKLTAMEEVTEEVEEEVEVDGETTLVKVTKPVLDENDAPVLEKGGVLVSKATAETVGESFTVLEVEGGTADGKKIMRAEVEDTPTMAGTYTDTLTFTVSVAEKPVE